MSIGNTADATQGATPVTVIATDRWVPTADCVRRFWEKPVVAWTAILLLQLGIVWRLWEWRDLPFGDTATYFAEASHWNETGRFEVMNLVFSPLYVAFLGLFQRAFSDAYAAIMMHKIVILAASASVALGLMRAVIPKSLAWLIAAWWVLILTNPFFLHHYDVHLFGSVILALGCWLAGAQPGPVWRGAGLACLFVGALFVRNEFLPAAALFAAACLINEVWKARRGVTSMGALWSHAAALIGPSVLLCAAIGGWMMHGVREPAPWTRIAEEFRLRQRANFVQVYPFGYQQRSAEWTRDPWYDGGELLQRDFGRPDCTFGEAFRGNPQAVCEHVVWNLSLLPAGLQLGLFGGHAGAISPDFVGTNGNRPVAGWMSLAVIALWLGGLGCACTCARRWVWTAPGGWTWLALLCCVPSVLVAIVTQRPRPSYILLLLLLLMAATGLALWAIDARLCFAQRLRTLLPVIVAVGVLVASFPYFAHRRARVAGTRHLLEAYHRLQPFRWVFQNSFDGFYSNETTSVELAFYLGGTGLKDSSRAVRAAIDHGRPFGEAVAKAGVRTMYLSGEFIDRHDVATWRIQSGEAGWKLIASSNAPQARWELHTRDGTAATTP